MRERNGRFKKGHKKIGGFCLGDKHSDKSKNLVSESLRGKFGKDARRWKGDEASYVAKHMWINKHYGRAYLCQNPKCEYKNPKRYEWHNISGNHERDIRDYIQLCPSCHRKVDLGEVEL